MIFPEGELKFVVYDNRPRSIAALSTIYTYMPHAQALPQRHCDAHALPQGACSHVRPTDTSSNTYWSECTIVCGVPYAYMVLKTRKVWPLLATLPRCFCTSTLNNNGFVNYSCSMVYLSLFLSRFPLPWKHIHFRHHVTLATTQQSFTNDI
jgi:hypothetical protein